MSSLGFMSDKLDRLEGRLEALVGHATAIQADSLGVAGKFGFTAERVAAARAQTADFVEGLIPGLEDKSNIAPDLLPMLEAIGKTETPPEDWKQDLETLSKDLRAGVALHGRDTATLQQVLDLLRQEVVACSNRLRKR